LGSLVIRNLSPIQVLVEDRPSSHHGGIQGQPHDTLWATAGEKPQIPQQALEPVRVSAGFHAHTQAKISLLQFPVKLLGLFAMAESPFAQLPRVGFHECNLLKAPMIENL
jgi:hypothetical protein